jgi:diguanylate cyclase (GGDEF)-like protein
MHKVNSTNFLESVLNSINEQITVIDAEGAIQFVNNSWLSFSESNQGSLRKLSDWKDINYLAACDKSAKNGDEFGSNAAKGIRSVINNKKRSFLLEYPCHSDNKKRWFMMRVSPFEVDHDKFFTISHQDITERKVAGEKVLHLSRIDGLTNISNRRYFDEFFKQEWNRCSRLHKPISIALLDIDHFKLLNDNYGHQVGDQCLKSISLALKKVTKRPGDLCARYGGEEFALIFGNTQEEQALTIINKLMLAIKGLNFPNSRSPVAPFVTVSVGIATTQPKRGMNRFNLIETADKRLYLAKENGRDQVVIEAEDEQLELSQPI